MTRTKRWQHLLDRVGKGMALTGVVGIVALAAALTATDVLAWSPTDYTVTTSSFTASTGPGSASQQAAPGQFIYDTATLTSSYEYVQSGTLDFYLYQGSVPQNCRSFSYSGAGAVATYAVPVADTDTGQGRGALSENLSSLNATPANTGYQIPTNAANGTSYYWEAVYNDGQQSLQQNSGCNSEPVTVKVQPPTLSVTTDATPSSAPTASNVGDTATVSNYATLLADDAHATGSVTFSLYQGTSCTGTPVYQSGPEALSSTGTASTPTHAYTVNAAGPYEWLAEVSVSTGSNWPPIQPFWSACQSEPLNVQATTGLTTAVSAHPSLNGDWAEYGAQVADTATVTHGDHPTGSVAFNLYNNASCTGTPVYSSGQVSLVNGQATSASYVVDQSGTWEWTASYSGDSYNTGAVSTCGSESLLVGKASPTITTITSNGTTRVPVGSQIADAANVSNSSNGTPNSASGQVDFNLYAQGSSWIPNCSTGSLFYDSETLQVGQPYSTATSAPFQVTMLGHFDWTANYLGDANDTGTTSQCGSEAVDVVKATPAIITINNSHAREGSSITDEAEITGGYNADTGAFVTFTLYKNASCTDRAAAPSTVAVDSNGDAFSTPSVVNTPGTYYWVATYFGNGWNQPVSSRCGSEVVWVQTHCPRIATTQVSPVTTASPTMVSDTATLTNFFPNPTTRGNGVVTFALFGPEASSAAPSCQSGNGGNQIALSSGGVAPVAATPAGQYQATFSSALSNPLVPGDYYWEAYYSGDLYDGSASAGCGELTVITQNTPDLSTSASPGGTIGSTLTDTATVTSAVEGTSDPATDTLSFELVSSCPAIVGSVPAASTVVSDFGAIRATSVFDSSAGTYTYSASVPSSGYKSTAGGTFYWNVTFSGDTYNTAITNQCGEPVTISTVAGGVSAASTSTPVTGSDLFGPGLAGAIAMLLGGLLLIVARQVLRTRAG